MSEPLPLAGRRVVVTRALVQAREVVERLGALGAEVLLYPAVSFSEPADSGPLDHAIRLLDQTDWVLFTSANAARFFAARCRKLGRDLHARTGPFYAAVGPATASVAAAEGLLITHVAREFRGAALALELRSVLATKRVLLPRSNRATHELPDALKAAGAKVTEVTAYRTGGVGEVAPEVAAAVRAADVDVISLFSPSALNNLRAELGEDVLQRLGQHGALAAVGPVTAAALREAGLPVAIVAENATSEALVNAIVRHFSAQPIPSARTS